MLTLVAVMVYAAVLSAALEAGGVAAVLVACAVAIGYWAG